MTTNAPSRNRDTECRLWFMADKMSTMQNIQIVHRHSAAYAIIYNSFEPSTRRDVSCFLHPSSFSKLILIRFVHRSTALQLYSTHNSW